MAYRKYGPKTARPGHQIVPAACLQVGDILSSDDSIIRGVVHHGLSIPAGKVEITREYAAIEGGTKLTSSHWNNRTEISIFDRSTLR